MSTRDDMDQGGDVGAEVAAVEVTPDEIDLLVYASGPDADYEALLDAVERIIAERVEAAKAEALREAADVLVTLREIDGRPDFRAGPEECAAWLLDRAAGVRP